MIQPKQVPYYKTDIFLRMFKPPRAINKILVVGCGDGTEVVCLSDKFPESTVYGIDEIAEKTTYNNYNIEKGDARQLRFVNSEFDLIYSYHVIEHIPDPERAVKEMGRVLNGNGVLLIGTPNKRRIFGYMSGDTTLMNKLKWNIKDWKAKIKGRFENELGEHAGFTHKELKGMLEKHFKKVDNITPDYYFEVYATKKWLISLIYKLRLNDLLLPAIYYRATK